MIAAAGYAGLAGFAWLTLFQVMLASGLPLGRLAWGGRDRVLPPARRWASLASALVAVLGVLAVAAASGIGPALLPAAAVRLVLIALMILFALSLLLNLFGARGLERAHGVPLTILLAVSSGILAFPVD